jgi:phosphate/sulfate permease
LLNWYYTPCITAGKIAVSWLVTVPVAALLSVAFLAMFTPTIE